MMRLLRFMSVRANECARRNAHKFLRMVVAMVAETYVAIGVHTSVSMRACNRFFVVAYLALLFV